MALNSFAADHFRAFGHFQDPRDVLVPDHIDTKLQNERIGSLVSPEGEKKKLDFSVILESTVEKPADCTKRSLFSSGLRNVADLQSKMGQLQLQ